LQPGPEYLKNEHFRLSPNPLVDVFRILGDHIILLI